MRSRRSEFSGGVRAQLPILLGTSPFGLIYGILAMDAGLPVEVALGMSMIVFAGSSQFIAAQLFASATPGIVIILTTFVVNLRHMLYSASVAPYVRHLSPVWKYLLAFLLTDEAYAVSITYYEHSSPADVRHTNTHWYFLGAGLTLWVSWQISTAVGIFVGAQVPKSWSLDFTLALTFIALVIPVLRNRPAVLAALTAGIVALAAHDLPYNLGLILAVLAGIAAGVAGERYGIRVRPVQSPSQGR
jgi:4-azaleucine resistance transporter AzlC